MGNLIHRSLSLFVFALTFQRTDLFGNTVS
nr:MAG TPA: hypothetical protein [Inoviridae sp.]